MKFILDIRRSVFDKISFPETLCYISFKTKDIIYAKVYICTYNDFYITARIITNLIVHRDNKSEKFSRCLITMFDVYD